MDNHHRTSSNIWSFGHGGKGRALPLLTRESDKTLAHYMVEYIIEFCVCRADKNIRRKKVLI